MKLPARGLYVITADGICRDVPLLQRSVQAALRGGAVMVQYRDKQSDVADRHLRAAALVAVCREAGVPLMLNDGPVETALSLGMSGVHLGRDDGDIATVRMRAPAMHIGATCGPSLERAHAAVAAGADYVAFGAFHPSMTKPAAPPATPALLREARAVLSVPICAIGGITPENAPALIAAGADYIAVISGVFGSGFTEQHIESAARRYSALFAA